MTENLFDVAIIGGGPAGSTAATLLARAGRRVVVLEKERFPRFHIGESLLPYSMTIFERLGILLWLEAHAVPKPGGEIATACGERHMKFYFRDGFRLCHKRAFQVERASFDQMLLETARKEGADIREECAVTAFAEQDDACELTVQSSEGAAQIRAAYVLDCSGRQSVIGRQFGDRMAYPQLKKFSCFAHYKGVQRDKGEDAGLTRLVHAGQSWFWLIPLDAERTSVGLVTDIEKFRTARLSPEETLDRAVHHSSLMEQRMREAERVSPVHTAGDYSYRHRQLTGNRWMLAGDAAGFIDPIFSTGVFLAMHSGELCADALDAVLSRPQRRAGLFQRYARSIHRVMDMYVRFVTAWYSEEFVEVIGTRRPAFQLAAAVNAVLAGHIGSSFAIWWRMQLFYLVLAIQRHYPLCPRLNRPAGSDSLGLEGAAA